MERSMSDEVLKFVAAPLKVAVKLVRLPEINPEVFHHFVNSVQNPNETANLLASENPALLQLIAVVQDNIDKCCQASAKGEGPGVLGVDGQPIAKKVVGVAR